MARGGDLVHHVVPARRPLVGWRGERGGEGDRAHRLLERAQRDPAQPVVRADRLALLGDPQPPAHGAGGRAEHGAGELAAAAAHGAAATVEDGEVDPCRLERREQVRLHALQRPARRRDPGVLVAVGVADHDDLATVAALEVAPVQVVGEERGHHLGRCREVVARLEQRRHVERHASVCSQPAPARQQQHGEDVVRPLRHAHDVGADGVGSVALSALGDGPEDRERPRGVLLGRRGGRLPGREGAAHSGRALAARALEPRRVAEQAAGHHAVRQGVLPHVERGEVKAERRDAPLEAPHAEQPGVGPAVAGEAPADQAEIGRELGGARVSVRLVPLGRRQPRSDQAEEDAVRHVTVARWHSLEGCGEACRVIRRPLQHGVVQADARARLGESLRQSERLPVIALQHQRALAGERGANRIGGHIGIAVHVPAHPGREPQDGGRAHQHAGTGGSVHGDERVLELLVERRHDAIHDVGEEEEDVLELVEHGGPLDALGLRLPGDRALFADAAQRGPLLVGGEGWVQPPHQQPADGLLLFEERATRGLGGMGREHRFEHQALEQPAHIRGAEPPRGEAP